MCHSCKQHEESMRHIFNEFQLRRYIITTLPPNHTHSQGFMTNESNKIMLKPQIELFWRQLEIVANFVIWREKCRRIFAEITRYSTHCKRDFDGAESMVSAIQQPLSNYLAFVYTAFSLFSFSFFYFSAFFIYFVTIDHIL